MKGIVLAGGTGSRLHPLTAVTNKHLLPVYNRPMIFYPIQTLADAGVRDIMIVTGGQSAGAFLRLLSNGSQFGLEHLQYAYQDTGAGIADAIRRCRHFVGGDKVCVILGDNILGGSIRDIVREFDGQSNGARLVLKEIENPEAYTCATVENGGVTSIGESDSSAHSRMAVTGIYLFDSTVFGKIDHLKPSWRGELEIEDVARMYLDDGILSYGVLEGWWIAAGTFDSLREAGRLVAESFPA